MSKNATYRAAHTGHGGPLPWLELDGVSVTLYRQDDGMLRVYIGTDGATGEDVHGDTGVPRLSLGINDHDSELDSSEAWISHRTAELVRASRSIYAEHADPIGDAEERETRQRDAYERLSTVVNQTGFGGGTTRDIYVLGLLGRARDVLVSNAGADELHRLGQALDPFEDVES